MYADPECFVRVVQSLDKLFFAFVYFCFSLLFCFSHHILQRKEGIPTNIRSVSLADRCWRDFPGGGGGGCPDPLDPHLSMTFNLHVYVIF